jgi:hypothetical protein
MSDLWPWLLVAGMGALHGLNPAGGWPLAAAWGVRSGDRTQALRALLPIAAGHLASVALVAGAVVLGLAMDRITLQVLAGALFAVAAVTHLSGCLPKAARAPAGHAGLAIWSFMMSTAHGAGLMLVPALVPLCAGEASALAMTGSGPLTLAFIAVGVHMAAMLAVTGLIAIMASGIFPSVMVILLHINRLRLPFRRRRKREPKHEKSRSGTDRGCLAACPCPANRQSLAPRRNCPRAAAGGQV